MEDFEKLGAFYLGRAHDLAAGKPKESLLLYDSRDLVTHALCVGMTGSGKTGLCLALLEEAAIDGIPAIAIDPKGDLGNLLLTFPDLRPEDFLPWVDPDGARAAGLSVEEYAGSEAQRWKEGLQAWGQGGDRIRKFRDAADLAIYTPGSQAGLGVSILSSFAAPPRAIIEEGDLLQERVATAAASLLGLLGVEADPLQSREHILIAALLGAAWKEGRDLDLRSLIQEIQSPPFQRVGVLHVESFYPSKDRFALAMRINNLLAAPGFSSWLEGQSLDIKSFLYSASGKPRISIFSIAHLTDSERMFFVSLLLGEVLGWMRAQPGTSSLRAILYMDEIFGYFPPVASPPSKAPLLTLLKQARAFGLGIVLATQNPVDLDYKGLANAGTWFIGRLQTERDKDRLLDGLEGAASSAGSAFERGAMEKVISGLGKRFFLMHNVHDTAPEVFQTRWTLSYLRGPLTRPQVKALMAGEAEKAAGAAAASPVPGDPTLEGNALQPRTSRGVKGAVEESRTVLEPEVPQLFIPVRAKRPPGASIAYRPFLFACARIYFRDAKAGVNAEDPFACLAEVPEGAAIVDWEAADPTDFSETDLEHQPVAEATWTPVPSAAAKSRSYADWKRSFADFVQRTRKVDLWKSSRLGVTSMPGESERDFRIRIRDRDREDRDRRVEALRKKFAPRVAAFQDRLRRAEQAVAREAEQAKQSKLQTVVSFGATILGAFLGRKAVSTGTVGRATTAARGVGRSMKESQDVDRAEDNLDVVRKQFADAETEFQAEVEALEASFDPASEDLETISVKPRKTDISVRALALAWAPYWRLQDGSRSPAWE
jgi:hypothetical protein